MLPARKTWLALLAVAFVSTAAFADPVPEPRVVSTDDTKWLVSDAEVILKLNVKQLMASDLMKKAGTDAIKQAIGSNEQAKAVIDATGLDVTKDITGIVISATGSAKDAKGRIVIRGKFDTTKIHDALKKEADKGKSVKLLKSGTTPVYEFQLKDEDKALFGAFVDSTTLVLTESKDTTVDLVKNPPTKSANLSPKMRMALKKFTGKESMAVALVVNEDMKKMFGAARGGIGESAAKLQTMTASLTVTDGVVLNVTGVSSDTKAAEQLSRTLGALKATGAAILGMNEDIPPFVGDLLNAVKVGNAKENVTINLNVTKDTIKKIVPSDK